MKTRSWSHLGALSAVLLSLSCGDQVVVRETEAACGNGSVEVGEQCDDGNETNTDECTNGCEVGVCGDGVRHLCDIDGCSCDCFCNCEVRENNEQGTDTTAHDC